MNNRHYWAFQAAQNNAKVSQQDIDELTNLAAGLLAFERAYCTTHGERTPVFRLLSMINSVISEQIAVIERYLVEHPYSDRDALESVDKIPF